MPKCDVKEDIDYEHGGWLFNCPFDAQYVIHQLNGKDLYLCKKHFDKAKSRGVLNKLGRLGRIEKLD